MEKLLRILFVMSAIAFVTTITACADKKKDDKTGGDDKFAFTAAEDGVAIDTSKDVVKITINPSLLTYAATGGVGIAAVASAEIFTVTFKDETQQGFIIPTTTAASADKLIAMHIDTEALMAGLILHVAVADGRFNGVTYSHLALDDPGFTAAELNVAWSKHITTTLQAVIAAANGVEEIPAVAAVPGIANIMDDSKVRVVCKTTLPGPKAASFTVIKPADDDDVAIDEGTKTVCSFSLVSDGGNAADITASYKAFATAASADGEINSQKMNFVGIVTGDAKASEITKAAGITTDATTLGTVAGFTAAASAKLVKAYKPIFQKVEIVIVAAP